MRCLCLPVPSALLNPRLRIAYFRGQTALHKAAAHRHRTVCKRLVELGACPIELDANGRQPRKLALAVNDRQLAHFLQSKSFNAVERLEK
ncbi:unnamed protein product [Protopolystoma xenopodis]|uniref:Uncharacterized protein n=1 Tax=Protopolystoma xenopodis TaxID=117903 RepID=A0A448XCY1_9PLAT|nr:unnamed protein product [Protopolystoma xenopodis]